MPVATPWEPLPEEVYPNGKTVAARVVEALTVYSGGMNAKELVAAAVERVGTVSQDLDLPEIVDAVVPLWIEGLHSFGVVAYPQLGGLDPAPERGQRPQRCSMMTVVDQYLSDGEPQSPSDLTRIRRCIDVRLRVENGTWVWEGIADAGGVPVDPPDDLSEAAARLVGHPDVDLPHSAIWDIYSGIIHEDLIEAMLVMAEAGPYRVTALKHGHPDTVFARPYTSNHTIGRAVDVWSVDGTPVVAQSARVLGASASTDTPAHGLVEELLEKTEVNELGSPWDLDGPATDQRPVTRSFTNTVHTDHLHVAFDEEKAASEAPKGTDGAPLDGQ